MKKLSALLFFLGVSIQLCAMFGEHATEIPFVLKIIAPSYYHAGKGLETLLHKHFLGKSDDGFQEITPFILKYFRESSGISSSVTDLSIDDIILATESKIGEQSMGAISTIVFSFSTIKTPIIGSNKGTMQFDRLKDDVEQLKEPNILIFCFSLFALGTILDVIAFFIESSESIHHVEEKTS